MNKELEEAIKKIKDYIHNWIDSSTDEDGYTKYEIDEEEQEFIESIETALNHIDNSIPTEVIENIIKKCKENNECEHCLNTTYNVCRDLQELLEGK